MNPTAVVFDVGNVLYRWDPDFLFRKLIPGADKRRWFLDNVITLEWHAQHDAGRALDPMIAERKAQFPDSADLIDAYRERWLETIPGPVPGVHDLVERLSSRGVPLYAITNFGTEFWARFVPTAPVLDHFSDIVVSGDVAMMKPDPRIFALALDRFGLEAGEAIFIDDIEANVAASDAAGFVGHHFTDAETLERDLSDKGLL